MPTLRELFLPLPRRETVGVRVMTIRLMVRLLVTRPYRS